MLKQSNNLNKMMWLLGQPDGLNELIKDKELIGDLLLTEKEYIKSQRIKKLKRILNDK
jgi:hypothetical protein